MINYVEYDQDRNQTNEDVNGHAAQLMLQFVAQELGVNHLQQFLGNFDGTDQWSKLQLFSQLCMHQSWWV